jgi:glycosyltransferase involved in cell wall biosynthesis
MTDTSQRRMLVIEQGEGLWGAQRFLLRLAPLLEERGFTSVLAAPRTHAISAAWQEAGLEHVHLAIPDDRRVRRDDNGLLRPELVAREILRTARGARNTARIAGSVRADLISANSHWAHLEGAVAARLARIPAVLHLHEACLPGIAGRLRAMSVRIADVSIAVSNAVANDLPVKTRQRVRVIRNGIDPVAFQPTPADPKIRAELAADPSAPIVILASRINPLKGIDDAIRAVAGLTGPLATTQLAVDGGSTNNSEWAITLQRLGKELLGERIRFLDTGYHVSKLLNASDVFVLASRREGLPLGILEAQACEIPVVAYPTDGVPEIVTHEETGLLAEQNNIADLQRQIERALTDPGLCTKITEQAHEQVLAEYTLTQQADRIASVLRSVTGL